MSKPPAFQLYAADFYMDTLGWSCEEIGLYFRLLMVEWVNGPLPNNPLRLAKVCQMSAKKFNHNFKNVLPKFIQNGEGYLINQRLEKTREEQIHFIEIQREKGIKRAKQRWGGDIAVAKERLKPEGQPEAQPEAQPKHASSSSSSFFKEKKKEKKITLSDDEWLKTLEDNSIYRELEVRILYGKMLVWCENNGKKPTRRRFVNWLNREDKPLKPMGGKPEAPKGKPVQRCQKCEGMFYHLMRVREMNLCPVCAERV